MLRAPRLALLTIVLVAVAGLTACAPSDPAASITAKAEGVTVTVAAPPGADDDAVVAPAVAAALELAPGEYLMARPAEITADGEIPASGVALSMTLPQELPADASGAFAYFDETAEDWMPVPTTMEGAVATATVDHLSLWTLVVTGPQEVLADLAEGFAEAGEGIVEVAEGVGDSVADGLTWWSQEGPGDWIYRQGGLLLGIQTEAPDCGPGPLPAWVAHTDISILTGYSESHFAVLRCVGAAADPERVLVKAAMNRGYGFAVSFAQDVVPADLEWTVGDDLVALDADALGELFAAAAAGGGYLDPADVLIGTTEVSFTVGEEEVRALGGQPVVQFAQAAPEQAVLSVVYKALIGMVEDSMGAVVGTILAMRDCDPGDLTAQSDTTAWAGWVVACLQAVGDEDFQKGIDEMATRAAGQEAWPEEIERLWTAEGTKTLRKALSALKWIDVVSLGLTLIDYAGDDDPYYVAIAAVDLPAANPVWEDIDGTWCAADGSSCFAITLPGASTGELVEFEGMREGCFAGFIYDPATTGANIMYCPAGAATPAAEAPMFEGDDATRDRLWVWQGFGAPTWFRG
ncbi:MULTISPECIES: hypothetical protein [Microbacterium]|uniref:DUF4430 domain-containing protein n=1 Tax=Microbacterium wangchenii TaxID=2541726 RepID=A0ABX5SQT0_9MICO|nr:MULTISPECIES: hypothetical protein [Microbacterium]MCK6068365.1 hypothetical protein [Microbacterium sp. EYE_512]QBR87640.1 hypothetical protein E4K62_02350 [Microbacterium wangchenii]TXK15908.1 hypothetical protein FVP99_10450 [Microbacterium wangchenii]